MRHEPGMDAICPQCKQAEYPETLDHFSGVCMECYFFRCPFCKETLSNKGLPPMTRRCGYCQSLFLFVEHPIRTLSTLVYAGESEYTNEEFQRVVSGVVYPSYGTGEKIIDFHAGDLNISLGAELVTLPPSPQRKEMCLLNV